MKKILFYITKNKKTSCSLLLLCALVAIATVIPRQYLPNEYINDKMQHVIAFAALTILVSSRRKRLFTYLCFALLALGGIMELLQPLINRQAEMADFIANCIGVLIIYIPVFLFKCVFEKKRYKYITKVSK